MDEAYDTTLGSSLFDYDNVTAEGVSNIMWTLSPAVASEPEFFSGYVVPAFPIIPSDLLVASNAVYAGVVQDPYVGKMTAVSYSSCVRHPVVVGLIPERYVVGHTVCRSAANHRAGRRRSRHPRV